MKINKSFPERVLGKICAIVQTFDISVGAEITTEKIYVVRLRKYFKSFKILTRLEVLRENESNPQDQILEILGRGKIKNSYLSIANSEYKILKRILSIPYMSESEIGNYLAQNFSDLMAIPVENKSLSIQYRILSKNSASIRLILYFSRNLSWTCSAKSDGSFLPFIDVGAGEYYLLGFLLNQRKNFTGYWINYHGHSGSLYQFKSGKIISHQHYSGKNGNGIEKFELDKLPVDSATKIEVFYTGPSSQYKEISTRFPYFSYQSVKSHFSHPASLNAYAASLSPFINSQLLKNLFSDKNTPQQVKNYVNRKLCQMGAMGATCLALLYFLIVGFNILLSSQNRHCMYDYRTINQKRAELTLLQTEYDNTKSLVDYYQAKGLNQSFVSHCIYRISEMFPSDLYLDKLEISHTLHELKQLELDGYSKGEGAIFDFILRLGKEPFIKECHLKEIKRNDTPRIGQIKNRAQIHFKIIIHV